jgi:hypothetical protein
MNWPTAALVGMAGGGAIEAVDIYKSVRWHSQMPWNVRPETIDPPRRRLTVRPGEEILPRPGRLAYCIAIVIRLMVSATLPAVIAATFPKTSYPLAAFLTGVGALATVEKLVSLMPLLVKTVAQNAFPTGGLDHVAGERRLDEHLPSPFNGRNISPPSDRDCCAKTVLAEPGNANEEDPV